MRSAVPVCVLLVGCVTPPQSRPEFVKAVSEGSFGVGRESYVVDRSLASIMALLEERSKRCLAVTVERPSVAMSGPSSSEFHPTLEKTGPDRGEFTLQVVHTPSGTGQIPPGGLYLIAEDLSQDGEAKTKVDVYFPTIGYGDVVDALREWTKGNRVDCPDMT